MLDPFDRRPGEPWGTGKVTVIEAFLLVAMIVVVIAAAVRHFW